MRTCVNQRLRQEDIADAAPECQLIGCNEKDKIDIVLLLLGIFSWLNHFIFKFREFCPFFYSFCALKTANQHPPKMLIFI